MQLSAEYKEGYQARINLVRLHKNPYKENSWEWCEWRAGWFERSGEEDSW